MDNVPTSSCAHNKLYCKANLINKNHLNLLFSLPNRTVFLTFLIVIFKSISPNFPFFYYFGFYYYGKFQL